MKKNKILFAALASAMLVGCADENFTSMENVDSEGLKGRQVEAGLLSVTRSTGAETRAYSPTGKFVWMPSALKADGSLTAERLNQKVGLCWTGRNIDYPEYSPVATLGSAVYTNYEFEHKGWLDVKALNGPKSEECANGQLKNGAYIVGEGGESPEATFDGALGGFYTKYYYSDSGNEARGKYTKTTHAESSGDLNLANGLFETNNASVFEGEYLVYYPYTDAFTKGEIVAALPVEYDVTIGYDANNSKYVQNRYAASSESAFALGYMEKYAGGNSSSELKAYTYNGFAVVRLFNHDDTRTPADVNIKRVMLYSETQGIVYSQKLDASKCVEAVKSGVLAGKSLTYGVPTTKNVIYADLTDGTNPYVTIEGTTTKAAAPGNNKDKYAYIALPVLPQTISDLQVILVDANDKTYVYDATAEQKKFDSYVATTIDINLYGKTFENNYMVVDEASLWSAWQKIESAGAVLTTGQVNKIKMLNSIRLENLGNTKDENDEDALSGTGIYNGWFFTKNIEIYAMNDDIKLSLASENKMSIKGNETVANKTAVLNINVPFIVEGAGCCEAEPAVLVVGNAQQKDGKVVFSKDVTNNGTLVLNNNLTANTVEFKAALTNDYDGYAVSKNKKDNAAQVFMVGASSSSLTINKFFNNNGNTIVAANSINLEKLFADGDLTVELNTQEEKSAREVNVTITELVNKANIEINKYALVTVDSKFDNQANAIIITAGEAQSTTDGRMDIKAGTSTNAGVIDNQGVSNFTGTNLINTGLFIDRQSGQVGGKKVNNGEKAGGVSKTYDGVKYTTDQDFAGIYVAQVETNERMANVLSDAVIEPSTNIVEILGCDATYYNMANFEDKMADKDLIINTPDNEIALVSWKWDATAKKNVAKERYIGHCVTVLKKSGLNMLDGQLKIAKNLNVEAGATAVADAKNEADKSTLLVMGNVENSGILTNNADVFKVDYDLNNKTATATFTSSTAFTVGQDVKNSGIITSGSTFTVGRNVSTSGQFVSNGNSNTVAGNFAQTGNNSSSTFAAQTTTTINGTFSCTGGSFERLALNGDTSYRATVNVKTLGSLNGGTTSTAWPTEF